MILPTRQARPDGSARYAAPLDDADTTVVDFRWPVAVDDALGCAIVDLMRHTTADAPIIGFGERIDDDAASAYLRELRATLAAGKCRLLEITTGEGLLIGLCTLRRNLNPNNAHLVDLAKGMIRGAYRGGMVLPAAFHEIALRCEADGVEVVTLDVRAGTPAQRTWERFGFETWGVLPDYARAAGQAHAGHFMHQPVAALKARALAALATVAGRRQLRAAAPAASAASS